MRASLLRGTRALHLVRVPVSITVHPVPRYTLLPFPPTLRLRSPPCTMPPKRKRGAQADTAPLDTNPDENPAILDGKTALRASPDAEGKGEVMQVAKVVGKENAGMLDMEAEREVKETPKKRTRAPAKNSTKQVKKEEPDSELSEVGAATDGVVAKDFTDEPDSKKAKKTPTKASRAAKKGADEIKAFIAEQAALKAATGTSEATPKKPRGNAAARVKTEEDVDAAVMNRDPEADDPEDAEKEDVDTEKREAARPPPVNSDYLPLPWKGRLGYVRDSHLSTLHANTLLRLASTPTSASATHPCSAPAHAAFNPSSITATRSAIRPPRNTRPRTARTRPSLPTLPVGNATSRRSDSPMRGISSRCSDGTTSTASSLCGLAVRCSLLRAMTSTGTSSRRSRPRRLPRPDASPPNSDTA